MDSWQGLVSEEVKNNTVLKYTLCGLVGTMHRRKNACLKRAYNLIC